MAKKKELLLDDTGKKILLALQQNARIPYKELAEKVNMSTSSVIERVRKMEEAGIIMGYRVEINYLKAGYHLEALVHIQRDQNFGAIPQEFDDMEEIIQYWELTGDQDFLLHVAARDTVHLDKMLSRLGKHGRSTTSLILSVKKKSYQ